MAKVRFNLDSGANISSTKTSDWFNTVKDLGMEEGEWEGMSDDHKWEYAEEWAQQHLEIYYEEKNL